MSAPSADWLCSPGTIHLICQFSGLVNFPFDEVGCRAELGGWILSGEHQGIRLLDGGYSLNTQEATAYACLARVACGASHAAVAHLSRARSRAGTHTKTLLHLASRSHRARTLLRPAMSSGAHGHTGA